MKVTSADVAASTLAVTLNRVLDVVQEPLNMLDFDDFDKGQSAMAATVYWTIQDSLGSGIPYGADYGR